MLKFFLEQDLEADIRIKLKKYLYFHLEFLLAGFPKIFIEDLEVSLSNEKIYGHIFYMTAEIL